MKSAVLIGFGGESHFSSIRDRLISRGWQVHFLELGLPWSAYNFRASSSGFCIECNGSLISDEIVLESDLCAAFPFRADDPSLVAARGCPAPESHLPFIDREWEAAFASAFRWWRSLTRDWLIDWVAGELQNCKLYLLAAAEASGLEIPPGVVTNSLSEEDLDTGVRHVAKAISKFEEIEPGVYFNTSEVPDEAIRSMIGANAFVPSYLQQMIEVVSEVRAYVWDGEVLAVSIIRNRPGDIDIRLNLASLSVDWTTIDGALESKLLSLCRRLELRYCSFDILLTADGRALVVDVNPVGSWTFLREFYNIDLLDRVVWKGERL